jgi:hypothetical protein
MIPLPRDFQDFLPSGINALVGGKVTPTPFRPDFGMELIFMLFQAPTF